MHRVRLTYHLLDRPIEAPPIAVVYRRFPTRDADGGGRLVRGVEGMPSRGRRGGFLTERRQFAIDGKMRDLHTGDTVGVSITVTCS